jgi:hypothetical protein
MRVRHWLTASIAATVWIAAVLPAWGEARVELVIAAEARAPLTSHQDWARSLGRAGVHGVRIRRERSGDKVGIVVRGTKDRPIYVVTATLNSRGELVTPGGRYKRSDVDRLAAWLKDVARRGPPETREPTSAFGLPRSRFEQVRADLARPVGFSTAGSSRGEVVRRIRERLKLPMRIEPKVLETLGRDEIAEELSGVSCGTALAYTLRPLGMGMVPRTSAGGGPEYVVGTARPGRKVWPVGWPPEKKKRELLPAMFEFLSVNVENVTVAEVLRAVGKRLEVPILPDHNALARHGIEPERIKVSLPRSRTTYSLVLKKVLFQARLKSELRVDEAGKPLLWVTSIKPL